MKFPLTIAVACLPIAVRALAVGAVSGQDEAAGHHLVKREPIYPTKVTVRALPAYPTKVTVRDKRELETTALDDVSGKGDAHTLEERAPPKITLKTVRAKRETGDCPIRHTSARVRCAEFFLFRMIRH